MVFHIRSDKRSNRILPRRNLAIPANQFVGIFVVAIAIIVCVGWINARFGALAATRFRSPSSAASTARARFRFRIDISPIVDQLKIVETF